MTSDFRSFLVAPKAILPAGNTVTPAQITALRTKIGENKTPYLYAAFGDVTIAAGNLPHAVTGGALTASVTGLTLKSGCLLPLAKGEGIDISTSVNAAMVLFFAT